MRKSADSATLKFLSLTCGLTGRLTGFSGEGRGHHEAGAGTGGAGAQDFRQRDAQHQAQVGIDCVVLQIYMTT